MKMFEIVNSFIKVQITEQMKRHALKMSENNKFTNARSLIKGNSLMEGLLAEIVFEETFPDAERCNTFDYDFLWRNEKIDIKSKTVINGENIPRAEYVLTIPEYSLNIQKCDKYVCIYNNKQYTLSWIVGMISKEQYKQMAVLRKKGDIDERNNFEFYENKFELTIDKLESCVKYLK